MDVNKSFVNCVSGAQTHSGWNTHLPLGPISDSSNSELHLEAPGALKRPPSVLPFDPDMVRVLDHHPSFMSQFILPAGFIYILRTICTGFFLIEKFL